MKHDKRDRRSLRTRRLITEALMALLFERRYEEITVQDILERAEVGRSTFYGHYFDKEDVLATITEQQLALLDDFPSENDASALFPSLSLLRHVAENAQYFKAMLRGHARDVLWDAAQASLSRRIERSLAEASGEPRHSPPPYSVASQYLAGAFLNMVKWWLEGDMPFNPETMDTYFRALAMPGVWASFGGAPDIPS